MSDFKHRRPPQRPGAPISAGWLNRLAEDASGRGASAGPGVTRFSYPGGSVLQASGADGPGWLFAYTGDAGILGRTGTPPGDLTPSSASCPIYHWTGAVLTLLETNRVVMNPWKNPVEAGVLQRISPRWGLYWVVNEDCV